LLRTIEGVSVRYVKVETPVVQASASAAAVGGEDLALLERHKPLLRFDRQYDYRVASVSGMLENAGNVLRTADGEVIARVGGEPALSPELVSSYPDAREPEQDDCICAAPDVLGDARRMESDPHYSGRLYGRAVRGDGGREWLQYWFWFYYNPKNLFGFGKHEGDWEMIQIGLDADGRPEVLAYAQHDSGETRGAGDMEWIERDGGRHPVVYVSPLSHASYFESGTHPYPIGIDHPYGDGPESWLPVEPFGDWVEWPGRWGNSERVIARRIGNGPPSPSRQSKWTSPAAFQRKLGRRKFRALLGRLLHFLGKPFYPNPPELSASVDGNQVIVAYRLVNTRLRRSRHLYLTVHDGERVIASRRVRNAEDGDRAIFRLPEVPAPLEVWGSTFNGVRQRSDPAKAAERG
jgi:hypothetical protein